MESKWFKEYKKEKLRELLLKYRDETEDNLESIFDEIWNLSNGIVPASSIKVNNNETLEDLIKGQ